MKKIKVLLMIMVFLFTCFSFYSSASTSPFINNTALDATFAQVEKVFLASEQQNYTLEITRGGKTDFKAKMLPKMPANLIKAAVTREMNIMKLEIELREEELGGLTKEDYKKISTQILEALVTDKGHFQYEDDQKSVVLSFGVGGDDFYEFYDLSGNFKNMGRAKDEINATDFEVKNDVARYINQALQLGKKISPEIAKDLPEKTEKLFKEIKPSRIVAADAISRIHRDICESESTEYGTKSSESIIEDYREMLEDLQEDREEQKKVEYFEFPKDAPTNDVRANIAEKLVKGKLSEYFNSGFNGAITLDELARLYFESEEVDERIQLEAGTVSDDAPDYIKNAFIYGMIDDEKDLHKPLTRLEAARHLVNGVIYNGTGVTKIVRAVDCAKIPIEDLVVVANCLNRGMDMVGLNFAPQDKYTRQQAIIEKFVFEFDYIRGFNTPISIYDCSKVIIGKNTVHLQFEDKEQVEEYIEDCFYDTEIGKIKRNGSYMRVDTGCALFEFFTPENGIKVTFKKGVKYIDFDEGFYGPELQYKIEPRILKAGESPDMNMQLDSVHKKIYPKLDAILAKTIKANMTLEQKIKAIHDFVVKHITYDSNYTDEETAESLLTTIDKGRGVCGDYTMLFQYLCDRAGIPCISEGGDVITSSAGHAWNVVLLNGQWKFVDTTWDDDKSNKVSYKYYLIDKFTFMKDHTPLMGVPDIISYPEIDSMKIKSQEELRVFLLRKFYWIDGFKVTFRLTDKKLKPDIRYLWPTSEIKLVLTYDQKNDLYTLAAKAR